MKKAFIPLLATLMIIVFATVSCGGKTSGPPPTNPRTDDIARDRQAGEGIFSGEGGSLNIFGKGSGSSESGSGIGVNSYLWRASLDTISFMPLASADPFGGVIITDWYSPPDSPEERFKTNILILGKELRSDGVRASVFRQMLEDGVWRDAAVSEGTATKIENAILERARQLRTRGNLN